MKNLFNKMKNLFNKFGGELFSVIILVTFLLAFAYGWIMNIIELVGADSFSGMEVARAIGIFVSPIGAVLGYI